MVYIKYKTCILKYYKDTVRKVESTYYLDQIKTNMTKIGNTFNMYIIRYNRRLNSLSLIITKEYGKC